MSNMKAIMAAILGLFVVGAVGTYVILDNRGLEVADFKISSSVGVDDETPAENKRADVSNGDETPQAKKDESDTASLAETPMAETDKLDLAVAPGTPAPTFDLLRVEPDGSTVIAGKGEPGTTIMVMSGDLAVAQTLIGPSGDFVIILDRPLDKGEHQLTLVMEDENGIRIVSEEQALVSIPTDNDGQVLAMVSQPGEASRIMTAPEADRSGVEVASAELPAISEAEAVQPSNSQTETADAALNDRSAPDDSQLGGSETPDKTESAADSAAQSAQTSGTDVADAADMGSDDAGSDIEVMQIANNDTDINARDNPSEATQEVAALDVGAQTSQTLQTSPAAQDATLDSKDAQNVPEMPVNVRIEAVEVEGDKLFVAGVGTKGNQVRVFVDDLEAGLSPVNSEGRFLLESTMPLSVGQHMITAALEDSMNKVLLRAVVPFMRPETEAAAAVASAEPSSEPDVNAEALSEPASDLASKAPEMEAGVEALSEDIAATKAEGDKVAELSDDGMEVEDKSVASALPDSALPDSGLRDSGPLVPSTVADSGSETAMNETDIAASDDAVQQVASSEAPTTIVQESLTPAASQSVIIRRGDTLWQIARRTYGQGVRYTTIYLANQDQIRNPNRISPGQIFSVPEEGMDFEEAEDIHMKIFRNNR